MRDNHVTAQCQKAGKKCDFKQVVQLERKPIITLISIINAGCPIGKNHTKMGSHQ
jgi:hypothetical protein